ncbi:MAG: DUF501 domain-containing protein [Synergistes sp.]|nr:DUF501 domain-containing protein [Synergistes sp.]
MMPIKTDNGPEDVILPVFWTLPSDRDLSALKGQMKGRKFDISCVAAVAKRCSHGFPQVVVTKPLMADGTPFPTLFWLTCPHLDRICGVLESDRKITEVEDIFASMPDKVKKMHENYAALRVALAAKNNIRISGLPEGKRIRIEKSGVGGIDIAAAPNAVKCLHLQLAAFIGMGSHPAKEWLRQNITQPECSCALCKRAVSAI